MNIVDTNGINHILINNLNLREDYYLVPDVAEEVDLAQMVHGRRVPNHIINLSQTGYFNEAVYLEHYKTVLNKYGGRSFFNMTGFGDVSIMATLHMLVNYFDQQVQGRLFDISEQVVVFTDDGPLTTRINTEFTGKNITVQQIANIV